ncbi:hypothetical protein BBJ66_05825 [Rhizobium sp. RSm-3]|nr:hypothetical protein BBJ66_05825 [Rhizobium sp. RSm-3]
MHPAKDFFQLDDTGLDLFFIGERQLRNFRSCRYSRGRKSGGSAGGGDLEEVSAGKACAEAAICVMIYLHLIPFRC